LKEWRPPDANDDDEDVRRVAVPTKVQRRRLAAAAGAAVGLAIAWVTLQQPSRPVASADTQAATRAASAAGTPSPAPTERVASSTPGVVLPGTGAAAVPATAFGGDLELLIPALAQPSTVGGTASIAAPGLHVLIERWSVGSAYERTASPSGTIQGSSLRAIADSIDALLAARLPQAAFLRFDRALDYRETVEWITRDRPIRNDGPPMAIDLTIVRGEAYLFAGYAEPPETTSLALVQYQSVIGAANFNVIEPVVAMDGRLFLPIDGGSHVVTDTADELDVQPDGRGLFGFGFGSRALHVWRFPLGASVTIQAPVVGLITLEGKTLSALRIALARAAPSYGAPGKVEVDGRQGLRWTVVVADLEWLGPVRSSLTLVVDGPQVYVMVGDAGLISGLRFTR
jgi:hypothetical protein